MITSDAIDKLKGFDCAPWARRRLNLFGSTARGDATNTSDIDLFIDVDPASRFSIFELVRAKHMVEDELMRPVDLGTRAGLRPAARDRIEREAVQIF